MNTRILKTTDRLKRSSREQKLLALEVMVRDKIAFSAFRPGAMIRHTYQDIAEFSSPEELSAKERKQIIATGVVYINEEQTVRTPFLSHQQLEAFITAALSEGKNVVDLRRLGDEKMKELYKLGKEAINTIGEAL